MALSSRSLNVLALSGGHHRERFAPQLAPRHDGRFGSYLRAIVHQHVPELLQVLARRFGRSPISQFVWSQPKRGLRCSHDGSVDRAVARDALSKLRDVRPPESLGDIPGVQTKPAMPLECDAVRPTELRQARAGP